MKVILFVQFLIGLTICSQYGERQKYPGAQFRLKQDFFSVAVEPLQNMVTHLINEHYKFWPEVIYLLPGLSLKNF